MSLEGGLHPQVGRRRHWAVAVLATMPFFVVFALSIVVIASGKANTEDLARSPHAWPERLDVLDAEGYLGVAAFLGDRVWAREWFRRRSGELSFFLRDDTEASVVRGAGDWLFLAWSLDAPMGANWLPRRPARAAEVLSNRIMPTGRAFRLGVAPNKATVYAALLGGSARRRQDLVSQKVTRVRTLLKSKAVGGYLDLWTAMDQASALSKEDLYYQQDTHWNELGAAVAARALVESLGATWDEPAFQRREDHVRKVDLARMLGLADLRTVPSWSVKREGVTTQRVTQADGWTRYQATSKGPPLLPPIVVLADSFGGALELLLPDYFQSCTFIWFDAHLNDDLRRFLVEGEIVYVQLVERDFLKMSGRAPTPSWEKARRVFDLWEGNPR